MKACLPTAITWHLGVAGVADELRVQRFGGDQPDSQALGFQAPQDRAGQYKGSSVGAVINSSKGMGRKVLGTLRLAGRNTQAFSAISFPAFLVPGKLADALGQFLGGHGIFVHCPTELAFSAPAWLRQHCLA